MGVHKNLWRCFEGWLAAVLLVLTLTCTMPTVDNPLSPAYQGSYGYSLNLDSLDDTVVVLRPYPISWTNTGADSLWRLEVGTQPQGKLDTTLLFDSSSTSKLTLYFIDTLSGTLEFGGIRPNRQRIGYSRSITVVNPFSIAGDTVAALGKTLAYTVKCSDTLAAKSVDSVHWQGLVTQLDTILAYADTLRLTPAAGLNQTLTATLIDHGKNRVRCSPLQLKVSGSNPPSGEFTVQLISAPDTIITNRPASIRAHVLFKDSVVSDSLVSYHWSVEPDSGWVRLDSNGATLTLSRSDSISPVMVRVYATIGEEQTESFEKELKLFRYAPRCSFDSAVDSATVLLGNSFDLKIKAEDTNPGSDFGSLTAYYRFLQAPADGDTGTYTLSALSWQVKPQLPGEYRIGAWVVDSDGNLSDTAKMTLTVLMGTPSFFHSEEVIDTFVKDTIVLRAAASAGNDVDTIQKWLWDLDGDGTVDDSTTVDSLEVKYDTAGQINVKVNIRSSRGDSASVRKEFKITVKAGKPTAELSKINYPDSEPYVLDELEWWVTVSDSNGKVKAVYADWNADGKADATIDVTSNASVVNVFTKVFARSDTGAKQVAFWCMDEDSVVSNTVDTTITVALGAPRIDSLSLQQTWVVDSTPVLIRASDDNGTVSMQRVDWDTNGIWDATVAYGDTLWHSWDTTFGDSVARYWVQVMDKDSVFSARHPCSMLVRLGRPVLSAVRDSAQWKGDTLFYVTNNGFVTLLIDTTDTNGTIEEFRWDKNGDGTIDATTLIPEWQTGYKTNTATTVIVTAQDNDKIMSHPFTFKVFPDTPPNPADDLSAVRTDSTIVFRWRKEVDTKDGDSTKVQIYYGYNGNQPNNAAIIGDLPTVGSLGTDTLNTLFNSYTFKDKNYNPAYGAFKVELSDSRGSTSISSEGYIPAQ